MWTSDIASIVFTRIKVEATEKLKSKYPDINFTRSNKVRVEPTFPNVYVKKLQGSERGQTLDGQTVNAILSSFQIEVADNVSDNRAQEVADVVYEIMKNMRYEAIGEPFEDNIDDTHRNVARYRRIIGYNDTL